MKAKIMSLLVILSTIILFGVACTASDAGYINLNRGDNATNPLYMVIESDLQLGAHGLASDNHTPTTLAELSAKVSDDDLVGVDSVQTLANKRIDAGAGTFYVDTSASQAGLRFTGTNSASGPGIVLKHDIAVPAGHKSIGFILYAGQNNNDDEYFYGYTTIRTTDETDGSEDADFQWWLSDNGTLSKRMYLTDNGNLYIYGSYETFDIYDDIALLQKIKDKDLKGLEASGISRKSIDTETGQEEIMLSLQDTISLLVCTVLEQDKKIKELEEKVK